MISEKLKVLICTEFDLEIPESDIDESTTPSQFPGWDSLRNVSIIVRIEYSFNVKLKMMEVLRCKDLGQLQSLIDSKIPAA